MKNSISMIIQEALTRVEQETTNTVNSLKDSVRLVKLKIIESKLKGNEND